MYFAFITFLLLSFAFASPFFIFMLPSTKQYAALSCSVISLAFFLVRVTVGFVLNLYSSKPSAAFKLNVNLLKTCLKIRRLCFSSLFSRFLLIALCSSNVRFPGSSAVVLLKLFDTMRSLSRTVDVELSSVLHERRLLLSDEWFPHWSLSIVPLSLFVLLTLGAVVIPSTATPYMARPVFLPSVFEGSAVPKSSQYNIGVYEVIVLYLLPSVAASAEQSVNLISGLLPHFPSTLSLITVP